MALCHGYFLAEMGFVMLIWILWTFIRILGLMWSKMLWICENIYFLFLNLFHSLYSQKNHYSSQRHGLIVRLDDLGGLSNFNGSMMLNLNTTPFGGILGTLAKKTTTTTKKPTDLKMIMPIMWRKSYFCLKMSLIFQDWFSTQREKYLIISNWRNM